MRTLIAISLLGMLSLCSVFSFASGAEIKQTKEGVDIFTALEEGTPYHIKGVASCMAIILDTDLGRFATHLDEERSESFIKGVEDVILQKLNANIKTAHVYDGFIPNNLDTTEYREKVCQCLEKSSKEFFRFQLGIKEFLKIRDDRLEKVKMKNKKDLQDNQLKNQYLITTASLPDESNEFLNFQSKFEEFRTTKRPNFKETMDFLKKYHKLLLLVAKRK